MTTWSGFGTEMVELEDTALANAGKMCLIAANANTLNRRSLANGTPDYTSKGGHRGTQTRLFATEINRKF